MVGAIEGAGAGLAYATVETFFFSVLEWRFVPDRFNPVQISFALSLFGAYLVSGAIIGVLVAAISRISRGPVSRAALLSFFISSLFLANVINSRSAAKLPLASLALAIIVLTVAVSRGHLSRLEFVARPLSTALLLIAPAWIAVEVFSRDRIATRAASWVLSIVVVVLVMQFLSDDMHVSPQRRRVIAMSVALLILTASLFLEEREPPVRMSGSGTRRHTTPNVLLVTLDTVRADHLSLYGYGKETTPFLKVLAKESSVFSHAISPSNWTLPGHASLFTGLFPAVHGARNETSHDLGRPLSKRFRTIAEVLQDRGYATSSIVANFVFLGPSFGLHRGFEVLDARSPATTRVFLLRWPLSQIIRNLLPAWGDELLTRRAEQITASALQHIEAAQRTGAPFFVFVNYMDAHAPYVPPSPYRERFATRRYPYRPSLASTSFDRMAAGKPVLTPDEREYLVSQYDGAIAYLDENLRSLVDGLRRMGAVDDTLIVITSDHGESFGEHGLVNHGTSLYEDQVRVPLLVKYPRSSGARVVDDPVSTVDLFTLIRTVVSGGGRYVPLTSQYVIAESFPMHLSSDPTPAYHHGGRAIYQGRYKLIDDTIQRKVALYDLGADPGETHDLTIEPAAAPIGSGLTRTLMTWVRSAHGAVEPALTLDEEAIRKLRALGYVH